MPPRDIAVDGAGNVYVADTGNHKIRKITASGEVTTLAGSGSSGFSDGLAAAASFFNPTGVAVDGAGNVYVADSNNHRIRKITAGGLVSTLAGSGSEGSSDGNGAEASFYYPYGVAVDGAGKVYVADKENHKIRKITPVAVVVAQPQSLAKNVGETVAFAVTVTGSEPLHYQWRKEGVPLSNGGRISGVDTSTLQIVDFRVSDAGGYSVVVTNDQDSVTSAIATLSVNPLSAVWVSTLAGSGQLGSSDGLGAGASFDFPNGVAVDGAGNVYVADSANHKIRKITAGGEVSTLAGSGQIGDSDGIVAGASFNFPDGVAVDGEGNVYVADRVNHKIRKITAGGAVNTLAGSGSPGSSDGSGASASFNQPTGVAVDGAGNVYVADRLNRKIRKITAGGVVSTLAGSGMTGSSDGSGAAASFDEPSGVAVDGAGNVYVADSSNHKIRKITAGGLVSTLAGNGEGSGATASFNFPYGIAVDGAGNVYVGDGGNHKIRKITAGGVVSTLAGSGSSGFSDGIGAAASFAAPVGVAVDEVGNVYVADTVNHKIRKITADGVVSTLAGSGSEGSSDGNGAVASFYYPYGVAVDGAGKVYVADKENHKIRKITAGIILVNPVWSGNGRLRFTVESTPNAAHVVQMATDLKTPDWSDVHTTNPTTGIWDYEVDGATVTGNHFYRVRLLP